MDAKVENKTEAKVEKKETWGEWAKGWYGFAKKAAETTLGDRNYKKVGTAAAAVGAVEVGKGILEGDIGEAVFGGAVTLGGVGLRVFGHRLFTNTVQLTELPVSAKVDPPKADEAPLTEEEEQQIADKLDISHNELARYKSLLDAKAADLAKGVKLDYTDLLSRSSKGQLNAKDRAKLDLLQKLAACEINAAREQLVS
jgi:hypothetical protein